MTILTDKDTTILAQVAFKGAVDSAGKDLYQGLGTDNEESYKSDFQVLLDFYVAELYRTIGAVQTPEQAIAAVQSAFPGAQVVEDYDGSHVQAPGGNVTPITSAPSALPGAAPISADSTPDELWQDVIANRSKWWDNRNDKKSANGPDFKHRDIKKGKYPLGLWLKDAPVWAKQAIG